MAPKKRDPKDLPWTENYPPLADWLRANNARCILQVVAAGTKKRPVTYIEQWLIRSCVFVIEVRDNQRGWNIYTATISNRVDVTLADAEARLGLPKI